MKLNVMTEYHSPLTLEKLEIVEGIFRKKDSVVDELDLTIRPQYRVEEQSGDFYCVMLSLTLADKNEEIYIHVKGKALFHTTSDNRILIQKNTLAIMFPYLRSYITSLTANPGFTPIVLPPMNIVAMLEEMDKS